MRPDNLFKLTPELKDAITRHPALGGHPMTGWLLLAAFVIVAILVGSTFRSIGRP